MSELKQEIVDMAESIAKGLSLDTETGLCSAADGIYEKHLPPTIPMEQLEVIQAHNADFIAAAALATGNVATEAMKKHKKMPNVTSVIPTVGKDTIKTHFARSRQVRDGAPGQENTDMKTKYGVTTVTIDMYAAGSRGALAIVKSMLSEKASKALGNGEAKEKKVA